MKFVRSQILATVFVLRTKILATDCDNQSTRWHGGMRAAWLGVLRAVLRCVMAARCALCAALRSCVLSLDAAS